MTRAKQWPWHAKLAESLRAKGQKPCIIPGGGSNALGALGYVVCALEMVVQFNTQGLDVSHVVHATGSAGTQAGLVVGLQGTRSQTSRRRFWWWRSRALA